MSTAFQTFDVRAHLATIDQSDRSICGDGGTHASVQAVQVFTIADVDIQTVALQSVRDAEPLQIVRRMTGNCDIVVVDEQLDIQALSDCQTSSFGIVNVAR